jgi:hypothetical protein
MTGALERKMAMTRRCLLGAVLCLGTLVCPPVTQAQGVKVAIGPVQAAAGQDVSIPLHLSGATGLGTLQCEIVFDPAVFELTAIERGALLKVGNNLERNIALAPGRAILGLLNMDSAPIGAEGVLAEIRGKVRGAPGQTTQITIEKAEANSSEDDMHVLPVAVESGILTVVAASGTGTVTGGFGVVVPNASDRSVVLVGSVVAVLAAVALVLGVLVLRRRKD